MITQELLEGWGDFDQGISRDPFPLYAELREATPVQRVTLADGCSAWLVLRYADALQALNDPRLSKDMGRGLDVNPGLMSPGFPGLFLARHMLNLDPPDHTRTRQLVSRLFVPRRMEALRPRVQEIADALLDAMADRDRVDLAEAFAFPLPFGVICELLGVPEADRPALREWLTTLLVRAVVPTGEDRLRRAADDILQYLTRLLASKRADPDDDVLSAVACAGEGEEPVDEQEQLSTAYLLLGAGHEATAGLIVNGLLALLSHPEQLAALRADESLIPQAVEEFLRYNGPGHHSTFRYTLEEVEIGGVTIPAHQQVLMVFGAAHRDPATFPDPDTLDVRRPDTRRHLSFGHGLHYCLGAPLARMEAQIGFASLLRRFPHLRLAVAPAELQWLYGIPVRRLVGLPVTLAPPA